MQKGNVTFSPSLFCCRLGWDTCNLRFDHYRTKKIPIQSIQMALRIHVISPFFSISTTSPVALSTHKLTIRRINCTGGGEGGINDASLASELAARAARMNAHSVMAEEAMRKSRKLLFGELCEYMGLDEDQAQHKWTYMDDDEKLVLVKAFLAEWGSHFHPLSARSTKEMLEEYLRQGNSPPKLTNSPFFFEGLNRIIGFP
ncbi:hypothetical protein JHK82_037273 [Glycine max]|nr:uncharacterized protein LOC114376588 [Glycine soja]KAG4977995.1 hypothetical protein JHK86_037469 [Glycine max]KAG5114004.1 hypothetical protein JHK82_037273 [Glycine max]KAH1218180.1 hypothetical protein GmHk_13G038639 [Glycine max]